MKRLLFILLFVVSNVFGQNTTEVVPAKDHAYEYEQEGIPLAVVEEVPIFEECKTIPMEKHRDCFHEMMSKFIQKNFYYPEEALENKIQGRVFIRFVIEKDGSIKIVTVRGPHKLLEEAATDKEMEDNKAVAISVFIGEFLVGLIDLSGKAYAIALSACFQITFNK